MIYHSKIRNIYLVQQQVDNALWALSPAIILSTIKKLCVFLTGSLDSTAWYLTTLKSFKLWINYITEIGMICTLNLNII